MASPDDKDKLHDIEVVLSAREKAFLELQLRYHQLLDIPANQRTEEEKKEANRKRRSYSEQKVKYPHLVEEIKCSPATGAERIEKHRQQRSDEAKEDAKAADRKERPLLQQGLPTKTERQQFATCQCHPQQKLRSR